MGLLSAGGEPSADLGKGFCPGSCPLDGPLHWSSWACTLHWGPGGQAYTEFTHLPFETPF